MNNTKEKEIIVVITTKYGDMKIKLYDDTPKHKENFIRLIKEGYYDSLLFHRVIKDFMIQGGDPDSKNASSKQTLGSGGPGYTIEAEILPNHIHKKGALAAARQGDNVNPEKRSSGSQFYIVDGKVFNDNELNQIEQSITINLKREFFRNYLEDEENQALREKIDSLQKSNDSAGLQQLSIEINAMIDSTFEAENKNFKFTKEQREIYKTIGGAPHLDGSYSVFGEVVEGIEIIDSIANVNTNRFDRPEENIIMSIKIK